MASKHLLEGSLVFVNKNPEAHDKPLLHEMVEQQITREGKGWSIRWDKGALYKENWLHEANSKSRLAGSK